MEMLISPHSSTVAHTAVTITPTATVNHHQTLPRASKAPLPPIRSTASSSSASTSSGTASSSIAPLTSILVNSLNQHHPHHYQQRDCEMATLPPQPNSNVITVDLVSSTTTATPGSDPSSMGGQHHQHHHHHHHHAHHHANGSGPVATANTGNTAGPPAGNTATLKKRVQIQEVTV
uniref:Uncharacterized protein n=1 Tax=Anopheles maculatus TaxID=74869 RepID=A0A182SDJ9_9DIPT